MIVLTLIHSTNSKTVKVILMCHTVHQLTHIHTHARVHTHTHFKICSSNLYVCAVKSFHKNGVAENGKIKYVCTLHEQTPLYYLVLRKQQNLSQQHSSCTSLLLAAHRQPATFLLLPASTQSGALHVICVVIVLYIT